MDKIAWDTEQRMKAEIDKLRQCLAVAAPPEGGPVVAVPVETLNELRAEVERLRAALAELVALKDGPRDAEYEKAKPVAWERARRALAMRTDQP
jgi:hypothetical protein